VIYIPTGLTPGHHGFLFYLIPDDVRELRNVSLVVKGPEDVRAAGSSGQLPLGELGAW